MNIANVRIGTRLGVGFGLILILLAGTAGLGLHGMSTTNNALNNIVDNNVAKMDLLSEMSESIYIVATGIRTVVLLSSDDTISAEIKKIEAARQVYDQASSKIEKMPLDEKGKKFVAGIKDAAIAARPINNKVIALAKENKDEEALQILLKEAVPATATWQNNLQEYIDLQKAKNQATKQATAQTYDFNLKVMLVLTGAAILLGSMIAWFSTKSITRPISNAVRIARTVAEGDLTSDIIVTSKDETGQLLQALKDMNENLKRIVSRVRLGTDTIATASGQIAAGNLDLSSRTEQQAASLEETASSMEELTSTVKQNSDNAQQANQLAVSASDFAVKGGLVVSQVVDTMGSINESARKISDIIGTIDGIAFQTNILALNAAVEAARAGEQGRGFAVVASEVRNLAQRSATAAKEIKTLIGDSVEKVNAGSKLVDQAGSTMDEIVQSIRRVTDVMGEISAAGSEQTAGIEQINQAVAQMDEVTQQNAALVEEAAAAAQSLLDQAKNLAETVSVFKIEDTSVQITKLSNNPIRKIAFAPNDLPRAA